MKSFQGQTFYELLEVSVSATAADIRSAFERLMRLYDDEQVVLYGLIEPEQAAALRARLKTAFDTLIDDDQRAPYDASIGLPPREPVRRPLPPVAPPPPAPASALSTVTAAGTSSYGWSGSISWVTSAPAAVQPPPPVQVLTVPKVAEPPPAPPPAAAPPPLVLTEEVKVAPVIEAPETQPEVAALLPPPAPSGVLAPVEEPAAPLEPLPQPRPTIDLPIVVAEEFEQQQVLEAGEPVAETPEPLPPPQLVPVSVEVISEPPRPPPVAEAAPVVVAPVAEPEVAIVPMRSLPVREPRPNEARIKPFEVPAGVEINGDLLRQVRMARGLSMVQLSDRTRISVKHLENVEGDRYDALPATVYLRGILMNLARELGLDGLRVAKSYLSFVDAHRSKG